MAIDGILTGSVDRSGIGGNVKPMIMSYKPSTLETIDFSVCMPVEDAPWWIINRSVIKTNYSVTGIILPKTVPSGLCPARKDCAVIRFFPGGWISRSSRTPSPVETKRCFLVAEIVPGTDSVTGVSVT